MRERAQSTLETAVLIAVLIGALLSMQLYLKRAVSGKLKELADNVGSQFDPLKTTSTVENTVQTWYDLSENYRAGTIDIQYLINWGEFQAIPTASGSFQPTTSTRSTLIETTTSEKTNVEPF
jgi:hypothetical protein